MLVVLMLVGTLPVLAQDSQPHDQPDESKERLIRKALGDDDSDVMVTIIRTMQSVHKKLSDAADVGQETQNLQKKILEELDLAIQQARQNMRTKNSSSDEKGDKQKEGQTADDPQKDPQGSQPGDKAAQDESAAGKTGSDKVEAIKQGDLRETFRQWGNLPDRDRDEIIQGINEDVQEKFREQINRYYEALAEPEAEE